MQPRVCALCTDTLNPLMDSEEKVRELVIVTWGYGLRYIDFDTKRINTSFRLVCVCELNKTHGRHVYVTSSGDHHCISGE